MLQVYANMINYITVQHIKVSYPLASTGHMLLLVNLWQSHKYIKMSDL
jgi:hypothetical protein